MCGILSLGLLFVEFGVSFLLLVYNSVYVKSCRILQGLLIYVVPMTELLAD
jgi:hypothetical protein